MTPPSQPDDAGLNLTAAASLRKGAPAPRPGSAGRMTCALAALLACACLGAAWFWLTRSPEERDGLRDQAAAVVNQAASGTPLAGMGDILRTPPPELPQSVIAPPTAPGTLSGRDVSGLVAASADFPPKAATPGPQGAAPPGGEAAPDPNQTAQGAPASASGGQEPASAQGAADQEPPRAMEDASIPAAYPREIARWLAARYHPATRGLDVAAQGMNQFGGVALAGQAKGGRSSLLRYVFQPSMIRGLYDLYISRFMADLAEAAARRGLSAAQSRQFHLALAGKAALWAGALEGSLAVENLKGKLERIDALAQAAAEANLRLMTAVFEFEEAKKKNMGQSQAQAAQLRIDGLTARWRRAMDEHDAARRALASGIRKSSRSSLDNDALLFVAAWAGRRMAEGKDAEDALKTCASLLRDLGRRCALFGMEP